MMDMPSIPFAIGQKVCINQAKGGWRTDWQGETYIVIGIRWDYQRSGKLDYTLASAEDIERRYGSTDGFDPDDLVPA